MISISKIINLSYLPCTGLDRLTNHLEGPNLGAAEMVGGMRMIFQVMAGEDVEVGGGGAAVYQRVN